MCIGLGLLLLAQPGLLLVPTKYSGARSAVCYPEDVIEDQTIRELAELEAITSSESGVTLM